jgi:four helix bundle protein
MRNHKDLVVWDKAHHLALCTYKDTQNFPTQERFGLTSQIRRAASSIPANLAERCGRRADGEMGRFVQIAMGSGAELSYDLLLCRDLGLLEADKYDRLACQTDEIMRMLSALSSRSKGSVGTWGIRAKS